MAALELSAHLHPPQSPHPGPEVITETLLNRFSKDKGPAALTLVDPVVVEISADVASTGNAFRHAGQSYPPPTSPSLTDSSRFR